MYLANTVLCLASFLMLSSSERNFDALEVDMVLHSKSHVKKQAGGQPALTADEWRDTVNAGCNLLGAAESKNELAVTFFSGKVGTIQSPYVNHPADLKDWGYSYDPTILEDLEAGAGPDLYAMYPAYHIDNRRARDQGGPVVASGWRHNTRTWHGDEEYRPTHAFFGSIFNVDDGLIVGWQKFGPKYMGARQNPPITKLPELRSWSDIVFLDWINIATKRNKDISNLRYIVSADITNRETWQILQHVLGVENVKANCPNYKWIARKEYGMDTDFGKALLASPNGRGAALLLIQHKNYFGKRTTIEKVTFWCGFVDNWEIYLMFHTKKQPDEDVEMKDPDDNNVKRDGHHVMRRRTVGQDQGVAFATGPRP